LKKFLFNISKWFFILLFLELFGSNTFFSHVHIVDGYAIAHSHPFKHGNDGVPLHNHSAAGYVFIYLVVHFNAAFIAFWFTESLFSSPGWDIKHGLISALNLQSFQISNYFRGPPHYSFL
jgi:hypothetical protein